MNAIQITHTPVRLLPDRRRVIARRYVPGGPIARDSPSRIELVVKRILGMPEEEVTSVLAAVYRRFQDRHLDLTGTLESNFGVAATYIEPRGDLSEQRRLLIGAYFTHEYSIEAAALGNPSLVPAPDQSGLKPDELRFVMSLRAIGEGHVSSIEFRSGMIDSRAEITMEEPGRYPTTGIRSATLYDKRAFSAKLAELGALNEVAALIVEPLPPQFTLAQLETAILALDEQGVDRSVAFATTRIIHGLASSNYEVRFPTESSIAERVIFPAGATESHGMEDARFVRFGGANGAVVYYATYTAYDGFQVLPQLIETHDFRSFRIATLNGECVHHKGMALFPRMIDGRYAALCRHDNENNYLMFSEDVRYWSGSEQIQAPERSWELMQIGNCGSPLETEAGWLVITHGVGPLRQYALGALLLDAADPRRVIGHLRDPLLVPTEDERDGYVPNVVYSCGSMIHGNWLVLPYGFSDIGAGIATVALDDLLARLLDG
jgi:predicted GH43/DUF377 family glycosyl hydrolase